ncbi:MAG: hypothetical protein R2991_01725 [Thermoanaerobaculia bacterium]
MPVLLVGLWAVQRPRISRAGLIGALLYGFAFVYFAHTTLLAIESGVVDYAALWERLGSLYTVHGGLMVTGGLAFGGATLAAGVLPRWAAALFLAGIVLHLVLVALPLPEIAQTIATTLRNAGLVGMGWALAHRPRGSAPPSPIG